MPDRPLQIGDALAKVVELAHGSILLQSLRMSAFTVKPLDVTTWPAFAAVVEKHNGVWGGCWCMAFHEDGPGSESVAEARTKKETRVRESRTHAALVFDGEACVGWCQFGSAAELPRIKRQTEYRKGLVTLPDWRITCFFVDRGYRGRGVARAALAGALAEIARLGGGTVESYPEEVLDRKVSSSFLHNASAGMFESAGFERVRPLGKNHWLVSRVVAPA